MRHHSIGIGADCNRKTDDTVGVCAGDVEPDNEDMEIEMEAGMRRPDRKAPPEEPTAQERAEHMLTHVPFRSWCRHCVRGRGKEEPCRQGQGDPEHPGAHGLYVHGRGDGWQDVGDPRGEGPVVEGADVDRRPQEDHGRVRLQACRAFMKELGCEMSVVTLKTDNEPASVAVADDVAKVRASRGAQPTVMENSPAHSSKSNGVIERGVQTIQGMVRTLRSAIEERWMVKLDPQNALWTWLVRGVAGEPRGGGTRRPDALRTAEGQEGTVAGDGVWCGRDAEEETSGRPTGQVVLPLWRRHLLGSERQHGRVHRGRWRRGVEDADSEEED